MVYPVELSCHLGGEAGQGGVSARSGRVLRSVNTRMLFTLSYHQMDTLEALSRDTQERTFCKWCSAPLHSTSTVLMRLP